MELVARELVVVVVVVVLIHWILDSIESEICHHDARTAQTVLCCA